VVLKNKLLFVSILIIGIALTKNPDHFLEFNGIDSHVIVQDDSLLDLTGSFTIEMWIKIDKKSEYSHILNKHQPGINDDGSWVLKHYELETQQIISIDWPYNPNSQILASLDSIYAYKWHHIALIYESTNNLLEFWLDGVSTFKDDVELGIQSTEWPLYLGSEVSYNYFKGSISEIRISSIVRYKNEFNPPEYHHNDVFTIAYWPCNKITNGDLIDISNNSLHGNLNNVTIIGKLTSLWNYLTYFIAIACILFIIIYFLKNRGRSDRNEVQITIASYKDEFHINNKLIGIDDFRLHNSFELLQILLTDPESRVSHKYFHEKFWTGILEESFRNSLHVVINDIRKTVPELSYLIYSRNKYVVIKKNKVNIKIIKK